MVAAGLAAGVLIARPLEDLLGDRVDITRNATLAVALVTTTLVVFDLASRVTGGRFLLLAALVLVPAVILARIDPFWARDDLNKMLYFYWTGAVLGGATGLVGGLGERIVRPGLVLAAIWVLTSLALIVGFAESDAFDVPFYVI
jgi:peptidoglycan/LPS O-acetylase OafA/YrhL